MDSHDKLDREYLRYKAGIRDYEFSFMDWWWGYEYEKWRIFIHAALLILVFSIINYFILHRLNGRQEGYYNHRLAPRVPGVYEEKTYPTLHPTARASV